MNRPRTKFFASGWHPFSGQLPLGQPSEKPVVLIGSGITSLALGALLLKAGYRVVILEKNAEHIGGHARIVRIQGRPFSAGPQYLWDFDSHGAPMAFLRYIGLEQELRFVRMSRIGFDTFFIDEHPPFTVPMGLDEFCELLCGHFPAEADSITHFFGILKHFGEAAQFLNHRGLYMAGYATILRQLMVQRSISLKTKTVINRFAKATLKDVFEHCRLSAHVRRILYGHGAIFLENEAELSFGIYAAATCNYHEGAFFPENGYHGFIEGLVGFIRRHNAQILPGKEVTAILAEKGQAVGVRCSDGSFYEAAHVVSNISPRQTSRLLNAETAHMVYQPSNTVTSVFYVLDYEEEIHQALRLKNFWWQSGREVDFSRPDMLAEPELLFLCSHSASSHPAGHRAEKTTLTAFAPGNFLQEAACRSEGETAYARLRIEVLRQITSAIEKRFFKGFAAKVKESLLLTPLDLVRELGAERGSVYGRRLTPESVFRPPLSRQPLPNVTIACATTGLPGIAVGINTAVLLFEHLSGKTINR